MEELLRYNFKQRYVVFDTETEGLNLITSKPWQIAWIECEGKKVIKKHNERHQECMKNFGVTMYENDKPLKDWVLDAQQESMDHILYLEKILKKD